ncbi:MAG TPA: nucleotidyltransferase family protein [Xanthomonadales bacterium]|nr:nucleotidyltransferase family protein [Xanthomonadales bacterium]
MTADPTPVALLLAAGASRRLGRPKQLELIDGETLIRRMARAALATRPSRLYVALGAEIPGCTSALAGLSLQILHCSDWNYGMGATLAQATRAIATSAAGLLVLGVDQPQLDEQHLNRLVEQWRNTPDAPVASAYADTLGTPVLFPAHWRERLSTLDADHGARWLLRASGETVHVIHAPQLALDLDDAQDFASWQNPSPGGAR